MRPDPPGRDVPQMYQGIAGAACRSRASAVKLFCLECVGYIRKDVTDCTATKCPLYRWRPYQAGEEDEDVAQPRQEWVGNSLERDEKGRLLPRSQKPR